MKAKLQNLFGNYQIFGYYFYVLLQGCSLKQRNILFKSVYDKLEVIGNNDNPSKKTSVFWNQNTNVFEVKHPCFSEGNRII